MKSFDVGSGFGEALLTLLSSRGQVYGPFCGADGVCRLQPVSRWQSLSSNPPLIPPKKYLFPPRERLWSLASDEYRRIALAEKATALVGLAPCDLHAIAYLDRVFADDPHYVQRRQKTLLIGTSCTPRDDCFCPAWQAEPPCDLFVSGERLWCGSAEGQRLASQLAGCLANEREDLPLPPIQPAARLDDRQGDLGKVFAGDEQAALWARFAQGCLSCGACSAVCPTCTCHDLVDRAQPSRQPERFRRWGSCVFSPLALADGRHSLSSEQGGRLRFRFEHKFFGFGPLRGEGSCVGCARCARACPAGIDLAEVRSALPSGSKS
ncbi:4Fe-4S dicluster domain-containing protein [Geoalkalibacter ferrihydriticus]|uniref:4Fe-4S dicluster domain-containing protein n=1 Tax=Geoalkalibacter ferrihydriticus TaxID=392333 RepID=A0A1G9JGN3_9BACT|nr:4Fe-4S dicluster domain-containing protein [Geoalkalibacter ferrihydriticus]SDL36739.1 4Fe-4S dicluster domain-containing protein [Geoalkalibacter ferrihydriticus]